MKNLITVGFTQNQAILLSPLFRKLFSFRFMQTCTQLMQLKAMISPQDIIICNGSSDFLQLDAASIISEETGASISACIFTDEVKHATLTLALQNNIPVILAELCSEEELCECAKAIKEGRRYMSKSLSSCKIPHYTSFNEYFELLTIKERIACIGMLQGYKHDIIASMLQVKKSTADTYCSRVLEKFGINSIAQLFQYFSFRNI
ncbi:MAG: hypothetical protein K6G00_05355 [Treponema sp.]|nr:hypothetical protein [Treponema sp.]